MNTQALPWVKISITAVVTALIAVLMWWVYSTKMEWYDRDVTKGFSQNAKSNPLLASTRLLEQYGYTSKHIKNVHYLKDLGSQTNVVIWLLEADVITAENTFEMLIEWTERGGHLILGLKDPMSDRLTEALTTFALDAYTSADTIGEPPPWRKNYKEMINHHLNKNGRYDDLITASPHKDTDYSKYPLLAKSSATVLTFRPEASQQQAITVKYENKAEIFPLKTPAYGALWPGTNKTEEPYVNVQIQYGEGLVTVLGDANMFNNENLKKHDNGAYLLHLLNAHPATEVNYFINRRSAPTLFSTLWHKFPIMLLLFGLALIAWVLNTASRLGPVRTEQAPGRTNLISHLRARGHFWRRRGDLTPMSEPVRQAALREIKRLYATELRPDTSNLPIHTIEKIARDIGCSTTDVQRALSPLPLNAGELPNASFVLQHILHKSLPGSPPATEHSS